MIIQVKLGYLEGVIGIAIAVMIAVLKKLFYKKYF
jgi:hypothetical protein